MRLIPLTQGQFAIVDDIDVERVIQFKWCAEWNKTTKTWYASRGIRKPYPKNVKMARFIMNEPVGYIVDHENHDTLDNRRDNLRICTRSESQFNRRIPSHNTSGVKGIYWNGCSWVVRAGKDGQHFYLGSFTDFHAAVRNRQEWVEANVGEFAYQET
jgi:HNH endonuclease